MSFSRRNLDANSPISTRKKVGYMATHNGIVSFDDVQMRYEPFPVAYIQPFIEQSMYNTLLDTWPDLSLFKTTAELGKKASLSERYNSKNYFDFLAKTPVWAEFYNFVKSDIFINETLRFLASKNIVLDLDNPSIVSRRGLTHPSLLGRIRKQQEISARFEFSLMATNGGSILPHTDSPNKLITLVISMVKPGEWADSWGGGTEICLPKDRTLIFNEINRYLQFDEVELLARYPFVPNQCICFIKTYNSWHQVAPLRGPEDAAMRKTLTINIERIV